MKWLGGVNNIGYDEVIDIQWLGNMNERFVVLCSLNQLVIGGSIFPHKRFHRKSDRAYLHKQEMSSNGRCQGDKRSKNFIRSLSSDDGSKSTPRKVKQHDNTRTRYNVNALKTKEVGTVFHLSLSNRFQPLQDKLENDDTNIETEWEHIKKMW